MFMDLLIEPIETGDQTTSKASHRGKQTYMQRMMATLESKPPLNDAVAAVSDQIEDFRYFDNSSVGLR